MDANLDTLASEALLWLAAGAGNSDHESVIFLDFDLAKVTIRTNTSTPRTIVINREQGPDDEPVTVAVRAKALAGVAGKVEEGTSMGLRVEDSLLHASCGATSVSLSNLADHVLTVKADDGDKLLGSVGVEVLASMYRAQQVSSKGRITLSGHSGDTDHTLTVGSGTTTVYTQELFSYNSGDFRVLVEAADTKHLRALLKLACFDDVEFALGRGFLSSYLKADPEEGSSLDSVRFTTPTVVTSVPVEATPCDGDIHTIFEMSIKTLRDAIKPLSGVVALTSPLSLSAEGQHVTARVSDADGNAKAVIVEADVRRDAVAVITLADLLSALRSLGQDKVSIGRMEFDDNEWISVTGVFDEASESEDDNAEIIVALAGLPSDDDD